MCTLNFFVPHWSCRIEMGPDCKDTKPSSTYNYYVYIHYSLTSINTPQRLTTKQQRDPFGPHRQNTTFPHISPGDGIFDTTWLEVFNVCMCHLNFTCFKIYKQAMKQIIYLHHNLYWGNGGR